MSTAATRSKKYNRDEGVLFLAFELGLNTWKLGSSTGFGARPRIRSIPARDLPGLRRAIADAREAFQLPKSAPVVACYEAGRDGFWLHRFLESEGVRSHVVDPASIEVNRRGKTAKTDRLDVRKLLTMLIRFHSGEPRVWSLVRVPKIPDEDARHLHRQLRALKQERTRHTNRIKGLLISQGVRLHKIPRDFLIWLDQVRLWDGTSLPSGIRTRIQYEAQRWDLADQQIRDLEMQQRKAIRESRSRQLEQVRRLMELHGIGAQSAWIFVMELFGWRSFRNRREIGALLGFTPTPHQSGELDRDRSISHAGNRHVRAIVVELAWMWLRLQPRSQLSRWYRKRFARGGPRLRKIGIVALARKLLIALWRYVEFGVVPAGATMST